MRFAERTSHVIQIVIVLFGFVAAAVYGAEHYTFATLLGYSEMRRLLMGFALKAILGELGEVAHYKEKVRRYYERCEHSQVISASLENNPW